MLFIQSHFVTAQINKQNIQNTNQLKTSTDSLINKSALDYLKNNSRAGLSIGIYNNNTISTYHFGSTRKDKQYKPTNKTVYEIGSISKTFTGTLLAQAVKDKKVKIDDDVRIYLDGDYPNLEYQGHPIKLSHLVSHISGLPNFLPDNPSLLQSTSQDSLPFVLTRILNNYSKENFFDDLHKVKLDTIPGFKFKYSNSSPQLLKHILEKVYQKSFEELLKTFIFRPLKMNNSTSKYKNINSRNLARGYNNKGSLMPYIPKDLDAAGGIFSTIPDMLNYLKFHLNEKNEIVSLSHKITMGDINKYAIGLNWQEIITTNKHKKIWQSGGTFGFSSYAVNYPELNISIVLLTNEADNSAQTELSQIADRIYIDLLK